MEQTDTPAPDKTLYRYYQESEFALWKIKQDHNPNNPWEFAAVNNAERISIMSVTEDFDLARDRSSVAYSGPLFFDIDDPDLEVALKSANQLVAKLLALGVDPLDIEAHLSGKKGVHIYVDQRVFIKGDDGIQPNLPLIYARMAMHLWVEGIDFQVYSKGKGRMVRPPNARRPDGRYKVQVSIEALRSMTIEQYPMCTNAIAPLLPEGPHKFAPKLAKIYNACKVAVDKPKATQKPLAATDMAKLEGCIPNCVEMLCEGKRRKLRGDSGTSFNSLAMQVGCWSKYGLVDATVLESVHERIAKNNPSSTGESAHSRQRKLQAMHLYLTSQSEYGFSCTGIKKLIEGNPECSSCPIRESQTAQLSDAIFLTPHNGNYYADKDCTMLVASFNMVRDCIVKEEESGIVISSSVSVHVPMSGESYQLSSFSEEAWLSKVNFKKALKGLDGVSFLGTDNDVARLRNTLSRDDLLDGAEVKQVFEERCIGLNYKRRAGPENPRDPAHKGRLVYVEPGFSQNDVGICGTHLITARTAPFGAPNMKTKDFHAPLSDKAQEAFALLTRTNEDGTLATILGWFLATHLKSHIYRLEHRFPILCISGMAGTGKNSLVAVMMRLCGVEGEKALYTLEAPQSTQLPFQIALSNSSTIPRVINELNPKSCSQRKYEQVIEIVKAAFDSQMIERGRIGGGDDSGPNVSAAAWKVRAPVVTLSEEPINSPAVKQRAVMLMLTPAGLMKGREAFCELERRADDLVDLGRVLIREALTTNIKEVIELYDNEELPDSINNAGVPDRLRHGYRCIALAYTWALKHIPFNKDNRARLIELKKAYLYAIANDSVAIARESQFGEVEGILYAFALLAHNGQTPNPGAYFISPVLHYLVLDNLLYLDVPPAYQVLKMYKRSLGERLSIRGHEAFLQLVESLPYCRTTKGSTQYMNTGGRPLLVLDMDDMASKGIPVEMFRHTS